MLMRARGRGGTRLPQTSWPVRKLKEVLLRRLLCVPLLLFSCSSRSGRHQPPTLPVAGLGAPICVAYWPLWPCYNSSPVVRVHSCPMPNWPWPSMRESVCTAPASVANVQRTVPRPPAESAAQSNHGGHDGLLVGYISSYIEE
jgi:hypothetical protein